MLHHFIVRTVRKCIIEKLVVLLSWSLVERHCYYVTSHPAQHSAIYVDHDALHFIGNRNLNIFNFFLFLWIVIIDHRLCRLNNLCMLFLTSKALNVFVLIEFVHSNSRSNLFQRSSGKPFYNYALKNVSQQMPC
jgi:hypothetical protein